MTLTREQVVEMANECGFVAYGEDAGEYRIPSPAFHSRMQRFAALAFSAGRDAGLGEAVTFLRNRAYSHARAKEKWMSDVSTSDLVAECATMAGSCMDCADAISALKGKQ